MLHLGIFVLEIIHIVSPYGTGSARCHELRWLLSLMSAVYDTLLGDDILDVWKELVFKPRTV